MKVINFFDHSAKLQTFDQYLSLTDQLNLGARLIELDTHFFDNELRIGHCGGIHSSKVNSFFSELNSIASKLHMNLNWDTETLGCKPSLSNIPAKDSRTFLSALKEINNWLNLTKHKNEILLIYLDCQDDLEKWNLIKLLEDQIESIFKSKIFTYNDYISNNKTIPTYRKLLKNDGLTIRFTVFFVVNNLFLGNVHYFGHWQWLVVVKLGFSV